MLTQQEKEAIFQKLVNGSFSEKNTAIQLIYEEFQPVMFKKLRYQYRDLSESEAQDIVQDAFLKLATTTSKPKSAESLVSWAMTIVNNTALDLFRGAASRRQHEINLPEDQDIELVPDPRIEGESSFDTRDCVSKGLLVFSQKYPENAYVISMSMDNFKIAQIAEIISRTEGATKQYIYESKKKLIPFIEHCL
jgi:RNA polymerase sigma factor (sigma-70 family)